MRNPVLVMMEGPSGAGKTTLAASMCGQPGLAAIHLPEVAIFELPEFAAVGQAFRTKTYPDTRMMLDAYSALFRSARSQDASIVADWGCLGMIEDLPCAQPDRTSVTSSLPDAMADQEVLEVHARDVRAAWGGPAILLLLRVPFDIASERVVRQRGASWVARHLGLSKEPEPEDATRMLFDRERAFAARNGNIIQAHRIAGWTICEVDASLSPAHVLRDAMRMALIGDGIAG